MTYVMGIKDGGRGGEGQELVVNHWVRNLRVGNRKKIGRSNYFQ